MKITRLGPTTTEVHLNDGTDLLVSYETPVAMYHPKEGYLKTDEFWSVTTSKHISKWLGDVNPGVVSQDRLDSLFSSI